MSARDIEGENPLYLPQAKIYDQSCALGPAITLPGQIAELGATGSAWSSSAAAKRPSTARPTLAQMARTFEELIDWLGRDNTSRTARSC